MKPAWIRQFPRFSEYDPSAEGEGSLDPLGFAALAERITDRLVPGLRARMSQPRFATLSIVGAFACQAIRDIAARDGKTTFDIAFEWLVVEALVRHPDTNRRRGLPGSQKAARALKLNQRLAASNYLAGPRVFGFTGVYRPYTLDSALLTDDGIPGKNADALLGAWEKDQHLNGFLDGHSSTQGNRLRREIEKTTLATLQAGHLTAPPTGWVMNDLANALAPDAAKKRERAELRRLVCHSAHETRNELAGLLEKTRFGEAHTERDVCTALAPHASPETKRALDAAIAIEDCATSIDYAFRRFLAYATSMGGAVSLTQAAQTPKLADLAKQLGTITSRAVDAVARLDESLAHLAVDCYARFDHAMPAEDFVAALLARHQQVQEAKGKRLWLDPINGKWWVRPPYRNQSLDLNDKHWAHPVRIRTLVSFLDATAP